MKAGSHHSRASRRKISEAKARTWRRRGFRKFMSARMRFAAKQYARKWDRRRAPLWRSAWFPLTTSTHRVLGTGPIPPSQSSETRRVDAKDFLFTRLIPRGNSKTEEN